MRWAEFARKAEAQIAEFTGHWRRTGRFYTVKYGFFKLGTSKSIVIVSICALDFPFLIYGLKPSPSDSKLLASLLVTRDGRKRAESSGAAVVRT